jgi:hypothetical protein
MSVVSVVCCQVEVSATSWSLVQRSPTGCGVSKSVIVKPRKLRRPWPPRGCRAIKKNLPGVNFGYRNWNKLGQLKLAEFDQATVRGTPHPSSRFVHFYVFEFEKNL